jgi:hypothetical protein
MKGRTAAAASSYEIDFLIQKSNPSPCDDLTQLAPFLDLQETFRSAKTDGSKPGSSDQVVE